MIKYFFLSVLAFLFIIPAAALAHSPYAVYGFKVADKDGNEYLFERHYGDGIFFADPVRIQVRNKNGAVVAHTATGRGVAMLCPSLSFCYGFVDGHVGIAVTYKLMPEKLDPTLIYQGKDIHELWPYMRGDTPQFRSERDSYPEIQETPLTNFEEASFLWAIPGFFILLAANYIMAPVLFLAVVATLMVWTRKPTKGFYKFLKVCGVIITSLFMFLMTLAIGLYTSMGALQMIFVWGMAYFVFNRWIGPKHKSAT